MWSYALHSVKITLGEICRKHKVNFHSYADDQQNYLSFRPTDKTEKNRINGKTT